MTTTQSQNKALVLQAFDTLFNKRDYAAAERFWSPAYIQHSAHIAPGRDGLFELVRAAPKQVRYENALIVADGDYVMLHGRFSGIGRPVNWIVADILRIENGLLAEHWDVTRTRRHEKLEERLANVRGQVSRLIEWNSVLGMRKGSALPSILAPRRPGNDRREHPLAVSGE